jgi:hypothetical protein
MRVSRVHFTSFSQMHERKNVTTVRGPQNTFDYNFSYLFIFY